jgi:hypothetical protein
MAFYTLNLLPSKAIFTPTVEDISGQVILDLALYAPRAYRNFLRWEGEP